MIVHDFREQIPSKRDKKLFFIDSGERINIHDGFTDQKDLKLKIIDPKCDEVNC